MNHPRHRLDALLQNPVRFSIVATLAAADRVEFRFVRDTVEISDSSLSQHVTALEDAGYVTVTKGQVARRPRTWLAATAAGRDALAGHIAVLNAIAAGVGQGSPLVATLPAQGDHQGDEDGDHRDRPAGTRHRAS